MKYFFFRKRSFYRFVILTGFFLIYFRSIKTFIPSHIFMNLQGSRKIALFVLPSGYCRLKLSSVRFIFPIIFSFSHFSYLLSLIFFYTLTVYLFWWSRLSRTMSSRKFDVPKGRTIMFCLHPPVVIASLISDWFDWPLGHSSNLSFVIRFELIVS